MTSEKWLALKTIAKEWCCQEVFEEKAGGDVAVAGSSKGSHGPCRLGVKQRLSKANWRRVMINNCAGASVFLVGTTFMQCTRRFTATGEPFETTRSKRSTLSLTDGEKFLVWLSARRLRGAIGLYSDNVLKSCAQHKTDAGVRKLWSERGMPTCRWEETHAGWTVKTPTRSST